MLYICIMITANPTMQKDVEKKEARPQQIISNTVVDFTKVEEYNTATVKVVPFSKSGLVLNGWDISFGNMNPNYPLYFYGYKFECPEIPYIMCCYGLNNPDCIRIQKEIMTFSQGARKCKQIYRRKPIYAQYRRTDFQESSWHFYLMLYLVWCKCQQNPEFAQMLLAIPDDWVIVENQNGFSTVGRIGDWGCKNELARKELHEIKREIKASKERGKIKKIEAAKLATGQHGVWVGRNYQGKILMACRASLRTNSIPYIDYDALNNARIYLLGNLLHFPEPAER